MGDDTPIAWVHRDDRYGEKLATPDTSIADLIGEVDPIKVAEGRYLSDELTLHYGLVPRTNRGIFAINELPDLAERIQVGLLNVLEERDVQVRGYKIRLPLDVLLVASANPEDYTNRGRIITPLKDRFGSQIRTHYPLDVETEVAIMRQEARRSTSRSATVHRGRSCPTTSSEVVATFSHLARASTHVNQRSGVSVRLSVTNYEALGGQRPAPRPAVRRARRRRPGRRPRRAGRQLDAARSRSSRSTRAARARSSSNLVKGAVLTVFKERVAPEQTRDVVAAFEEGVVAHTGEDVPSVELKPGSSSRCRALRAPVAGADRRRRVTGRGRPPRSSSCSRACTCRSA